MSDPKPAKAPKAAKPVEDKKPGIGAVAIEAILAGQTNEEALAAVKKAHPEAGTGMASIGWYRNKLRAESATMTGTKKPVPTSRELKKAAEPAKPAKAPKAAKAGKDDPLA